MNSTDLRADLSRFSNKEITFTGLGNRYRSDDAAGLELLELIRGKGIFPGARFISAGTNPENFLERILSSNPGLVVFIDACDFGGNPGDIRWMEPGEIKNAGISTHAYSITLIENYLNLGRKVACRYLAVQPGNTGIGEDLSPGMLRRINEFFE